MINKNKNLNFVEFYLLDFFQQSLKKANGTITDENFTLLEKMSDIILNNDDYMPGVEKLAQFEGSNEFAIFLFDMVERLKESSTAAAIYEALPNLMDDFINLFNLIIEEPKNLEDLKKALKDETPKNEKEPLLDFNAFYHNEYQNILNSRLSLIDDEKERSEILAVYNAFIENAANLAKGKNFSENIHKILDNASHLKPKKLGLTNLKDLTERINNIIDDIKELSANNREWFVDVIKTGELPALDNIEKQPKKNKKIKPIKEKKHPKIIKEDTSNEAATIDNVLFEYFNSEVADHLRDLRKQFDSEFAKVNYKKIYKISKSFKEISMIHGYPEIEYLLSNIIRFLEDFLKNDYENLENFNRKFYELLGNFEDVKKYIDIDREHENIVGFVDDLEQLKTELVLKTKDHNSEDINSDSEKQNAAVENAEIPVNEQYKKNEEASRVETNSKKELQNDFPYADSENMEKVIVDIFTLLVEKINKVDFANKSEENYRQIKAFILNISSLFQIILPKIYDNYLAQLVLRIDQLQTQKKSEFIESLNQIDEICQNLKNFSFENSYEKTAPPEREEPAFSIEDKDQLNSALIETYMNQLTARLHEQSRAASDMVLLDHYSKMVSLFISNLKLLNLDSYIPYFKYLVSEISQGLNTIPNDYLFEIENSTKLVMDRIKSHGQGGNASDILETLKEVKKELIIEPDEPTATEEVKEQTTDQEKEFVEENESAADLREDDELLFQQEAKQYLDKMDTEIQKLLISREDRPAFKEVENAVHSIKIGAQVLGIEQAVNISSPMEDIAELFGNSTIPVPKIAPERLNEGYIALVAFIENGEEASPELIKNLNAVLDNLMIEDYSDDKDPFPKTDEAKFGLDEKPLFAESDEEDLLEIFKEESAGFIEKIENAIHHLYENKKDINAIKIFESSVHSLKSAAKMLGLRDAGQISDSLEIVVEALLNLDIDCTETLLEKLSTAVETVKKISAGNGASAAEVANIINALELRELKRGVMQATDIVVGAEENKRTEEMKNYFLEESKELLENLNLDLIELERMPDSETRRTKILRNLHTLKGSAMTVKYEKIGSLAHKLENYFQFYAQQTATNKGTLIPPAFTIIDLIQDLVENIESKNIEETDSYMSRLAEIDNKLFLIQNFQSNSDIELKQPRPENKIKQIAQKTTDDEGSIKIHTHYLDNLINMATELVVNRTELTSQYDDLKKVLSEIDLEKKKIYKAGNQIEEYIENFENGKELKNTSDKIPHKNDENLLAFSDNVRDISKEVEVISGKLNRMTTDLEKNLNRFSNLSAILHSDILKVRMVPVDKLFNRFVRPMRDLAHSQNKKIEIKISGQETEMDRAMIDGLVDPLMHILRNAVDHGLETIEERKAEGKNEIGEISLRAHQDKNQVVFEINDDGRGIDIEKVKNKIVELNLADLEKIDQMSEPEILNFLFYPEFSTRDEVTDVSGRGVGLDVALNQIHKLKGNIRVNTIPKKGTQFSIRVPLTLIISQAIMTRCNHQSIAVPISAIQDSIEIKNNEILVDDNRKYLNVRGTLLPYIALNDILKFGDTESEESKQKTALILHDAGISIALGISNIEGRKEIIIKSLGAQLQNVEFVAGGAIHNNGEVALILDYAAVVKFVELQFFGNTKQAKNEKILKIQAHSKKTSENIDEVSEFKAHHIVKIKTITNRKPKVLVCDDSNSVRNFVSSVLEKNGYTSIKAANGKVALEILETEIIDCIITDLEMPEISGTELIRHLRANRKYDEIPIVILSGRSEKAFKIESSKLGANGFITKPFKENDLLDAVRKYIEL
jgi:chemotaxis protein histidine kinase CheA/ActR/RegA family two-component response regulator